MTNVLIIGQVQCLRVLIGKRQYTLRCTCILFDTINAFLPVLDTKHPPQTIENTGEHQFLARYALHASKM